MWRGMSALLFAFVLAACPLVAHADVPTVSTGPISTTAASGTMNVLPLNGQSTCTYVLYDTGTATVTAQGSADGVTLATNPNFGTNGVISVNSTAQTIGGNVAAFPKAFTGSWASNTGVLTYSETCTLAVQGGGGGAGGNVTVTNAVSLVTWSYTDISASGNTVIKPQPGTIAGVVNLATTAQAVTITCFDNASTNSGNILIAQILGAQQIALLPAPGVATAAGITCNLSGAATVGIGVIWK